MIYSRERILQKFVLGSLKEAVDPLRLVEAAEIGVRVAEMLPQPCDLASPYMERFVRLLRKLCMCHVQRENVQLWSLQPSRELK